MTTPSQHHQPTLTTKRLKLVPLSEEHLPLQLQLDSDPKVLRYLKPQPRTAQEIRENLLSQKTLAINSPGLGYWVGLFENEPVGWFLLQPPEREDQQGPAVEGQVELGYRLLRKFWRRGFASEGSRKILRYCFESTLLGVERVFAETMVVNEASRATMVKVGMRFVRYFEIEIGEEELVEGAEKGEVEYAITKEEWRELVKE